MSVALTARPLGRAAARVLLAVLTAAVLTVSGIVAAPQAEAVDTSFDPGMIITDKKFYDSSSMTAAQIQTFLEGKVPVCKDADLSNDITCLRDYVTAITARSEVATSAGTVLCKAIAAKSSASAATVIDTVARACGVSQKVLLVTLQKEQGLVTHTDPGAIRYRSAMGYGCPDGAPCDSEYYGFYNQVYNAALQFKRYQAYPTRYGYIAGMTNAIKYNPDSACGTKSVVIANQATAGLYNYTPYTPNAAALAAGYGTGDSCSSYGNRNFFLFYSDWFGSPKAAVSVVTLTAPAVVQTMADTTLAITGDSTKALAVTLQYSSDGTTWTTSPRSITLSGGKASTVVNPPSVRWYRVDIDGVLSDPVMIETSAVSTAGLAGPAVVKTLSDTTLTITGDTSEQVPVVLEYSADGETWTASPREITLVDGTATTVVNPPSERWYRVSIDRMPSNIVVVETSAVSEADLDAPAVVQTLADTTLTITGDTSDQVPVVLQYRTDGGSWKTSPRDITLVDGTATTEVNPPSERSYRVLVDRMPSNDVVIQTSAVSEAVLEAPAFASVMQDVTLTVTGDTSDSVPAQLQYSDDGETWTTSWRSLTLVGGRLSTVVNPPADRWYRVVVDHMPSNPVQVRTADVSVAGPTLVRAGSGATLTVASDVPGVEEATLWYRDAGGEWRRSIRTLTLTDGTTTTVVNPPAARDYRIEVAGALSDVLAIETTKERPLVAAWGLQGTVPVASGAGVPLTVDIGWTSSATATLYYRSPGGAWIRSSRGVPISGGTATTVVNPPSDREYRVVVAGRTSNTVTLAPAAVSVGLSVGSTAVPAGGSTVATITLSPVVNATATLEYTLRGVWTASARTIDIVDGTATTVLRPSEDRQYRIAVGGQRSPVVSLTLSGS